MQNRNAPKIFCVAKAGPPCQWTSLRDRFPKAIRPGEAKLEKATAAQKANQVVCSSQVLLPLQYDATRGGGAEELGVVRRRDATQQLDRRVEVDGAGEQRLAHGVDFYVRLW